MVSVAWGCVELVLRTFLTYILVEQLPSCEDWYHGAAGVPSSATFFYHISLKLERSMHQERFLCSKSIQTIQVIKYRDPLSSMSKARDHQMLGVYSGELSLQVYPDLSPCCRSMLSAVIGERLLNFLSFWFEPLQLFQLHICAS